MTEIKKKTSVAKRKTSPRGNGKWKGSPAKKATSAARSERMKALWQDPEFVEKMRLRNVALAAARAEDPEKFNRTNIPDGMRRAEAAPLYAKARETAIRIVKQMKDDDDSLPVIAVPDSDADRAELALVEAITIALAPGSKVVKLSAINTVLAYTKAKPESKSKITLDKSEEFLDLVAQDNSGRED